MINSPSFGWYDSDGEERACSPTNSLFDGPLLDISLDDTESEGSSRSVTPVLPGSPVSPIAAKVEFATKSWLASLFDWFVNLFSGMTYDADMSFTRFTLGK